MTKFGPIGIGTALLLCMFAFSAEPQQESGIINDNKEVCLPQTEDNLTSIVRGNDPKAAIDAAWTITSNRGIMFRDVRPGYSTPMSARQLGWFLGVLDSKLPCNAPGWWREAIANAEYIETPASDAKCPHYRHFFNGINKGEDPYSVLQEQEADSDEVSLTVGDSSYYNDRDTQIVHFDRNGCSVELPFELLSGTPEKGVPFSGTAKVFSIYKDNLYFCDVGPERCDYVSLSAFNCTDRIKIWDCVIQGGRRRDSDMPLFSTIHYIDIVISDTSLFVFGVHYHAAYIECHDLRTGVEMWKFTTADWPVYELRNMPEASRGGTD